MHPMHNCCSQVHITAHHDEPYNQDHVTCVHSPASCCRYIALRRASDCSSSAQQHLQIYTSCNCTSCQACNIVQICTNCCKLVAGCWGHDPCLPSLTSMSYVLRAPQHRILTDELFDTVLQEATRASKHHKRLIVHLAGANLEYRHLLLLLRHF